MKNYLEIQKNGFVLFKEVFSPVDLDVVRSSVNKIFSDDVSFFDEHINPEGMKYYTFKKDILEIAEIRELIFSSEFISRVKSVLNTEKIIYFGDSSLMVNAGERGFHKDNIQRSNPNSNEWNSDYDIVRVGIYLQDTSKYSGGLQLRKGSHRSSNRWKGKIFTALAEQGDFLVWKLTTTHSGNTLIPRIFGDKLKLIPRISTWLPRSFFKPYDKNRIAIFMAFANYNSTYVDDYINFLKNQPYKKDFNNDSVNQSFKLNCIDEGLFFRDNL